MAQSPSPPTLLERIHTHVDRLALGKHPFYVAFNEGRLSRPRIAYYLCNFAHFERRLPEFLNAVMENCPIPRVRQIVWKNYRDEAYGERNHMAMFLDFCEWFGLAREQVLAAPASPAMGELLNKFSDICTLGSWQEGLSVIYGWEVQFFGLATLKLNALATHWDMPRHGPQADFWNEHAPLDIIHSEREAACLAAYTPKEEGTAVEDAAVVGLDRWYSFLTESHTIPIPGEYNPTPA